MSFPSILLAIQDYLIREPIALSKQLSDGRINSSFNEDEIIQVLKKRFSIIVPNSREWYDFAIEDDGHFYPVNIKVSTTLTTDNLNCKLGIYYALTGQMPIFKNGVDWATFLSALKRDLGKNQNQDYYFLVINKNNPQDVFLNSLKALRTLQANGNNLPFQCCWNDNRQPSIRSFADSKDFILNAFAKSIELRAQIYFDFQELFHE